MAKIRDEDIDALRERADVVEIMSDYTRLKKSGTHTLKGLCPFHSEKTPSFTLNSAKGLFHCFGCGQGGDIYNFVERVENLSFPEAAEWLARKTGFVLQYEEMRPGEQKIAGLKARIIAANEAATAFWHDRLASSPDGLSARRYLEGRGFGRDVAERWKLGFAPAGDALTRHLAATGFTHRELEQADLTRKSERDGSHYDTFRGRIIFPTWNLQGDVVGFGARALGDAQPKYLNSSETPAFSKSRVLYGLNRAKSPIARDLAVVVEGYTDVIALHEAGIDTAVATNGVALGDSHFEILKKFTGRVVLMLDSDDAGKGATERSFDIYRRIGIEVLVALLPPGRDPADVATEDGADGIRKAIETAHPLLEFKVEQAIGRLLLDTPEARASAVREVVKVLRSSSDPIVRHEYVFMAARRIGVEPDAIRRALNEEPVYAAQAEGAARETRRFPGHVKVEREALSLLLTETGHAASWSSEADESYFTSPSRKELFREARASLSHNLAKSSAIATRLSHDAMALFTELTVGVEGSGYERTPERVHEVFVRLKVFALEREIKSRRDVLQEVNPVNDPTEHDQLFTQLVGLEAKRRDLLQLLQGAA
ncbi:MAG: DNA primase [Actinobacteria bacterium]|nr:DNA primase [Actinomycetota bacterium]